MATVQVKYLGKSKRNFAVHPRGTEYKWKPGMTHLEMDEDHARVLVAERPDLWEVDSAVAVDYGVPDGDMTTKVKMSKRGGQFVIDEIKTEKPDESG